MLFFSSFPFFYRKNEKSINNTLNNETAEEVCYLLLQVHGVFGTPRFLVSDGAPAFISKGFEQCCKLLGIKHNVTHPYHPEAHGIVERENREVIDNLNIQ